MSDEVTGHMKVVQPNVVSRSRQPHIVWSMSIDEAEQVGQAICDTYVGTSDIAYNDGARLMELAEQCRRQHDYEVDG